MSAYLYLPPQRHPWWERVSLVVAVSLVVFLVTTSRIDSGWKPAPATQQPTEQRKITGLSGTSVQRAPTQEDDPVAAAENRRRLFWALIIRDIARHPLGVH